MIRDLAIAVAFFFAAPAGAQQAGTADPHAAHTMSAPPQTETPACAADHAALGHCSLLPPPAAPAPTQPPAAIDLACPPEHAAMGHCTPAASPASTAAASPPRTSHSAAALSGPDHAADAIWGADIMRPVRRAVYAEHGTFRGSKLLIDRFEYRAQ
ncbi:MAG: hypothetical protein ABW128_20440, partial [Rhizorhabdus sp.]